MPNMLSGGPTGLSGPPAALQGALGAAPQQQPNMLAGPNAGGAQQAPIQPPDKVTLVDVAHKTSYVNAALGELMSKPNLTERDIVDSVGDMIAEQAMNTFQAAKYLADLPDNPAQLRQWVAQHYVTSKQTLQTVSEMLQAHGNMMRRAAALTQTQPGLPMANPSMLSAPPQAPTNMLSGAGG